MDANLSQLEPMDPLSKRIVFSWIATDIIWAALFIFAERRAQT